MGNGTQKREKSPMERHVHTILLSIITIAICWGSSQLFNLSIAMAKVQVSIEQLTQDRETYVTKDYAAERAKARDAQLAEFDKRITKMENKIDTLKVFSK